MQRLEAALHGTRPPRRPSPHRPGDALEIRGSEVLQLEQIPEKSSRAVGDDDRIRLGDPLQARREVRRLADDAALLRVPRSDQVADDYQAGCNSDTTLQGSARLKRGHRCDQFEPRSHCPICVVLVGPGIAKIHEDTVAHVFRNEPVVALHRARDTLLISRNDVPQILGIHSRGELCRTDQVGKHHRDLPTLSGVQRVRHGMCHSRNGVRGCAFLDVFKVGNRTQQLAAMSEQDAKLLQILVRQIGEDAEVDPVLIETPGVLSKTELFEPVRNLPHRGSSSRLAAARDSLLF